jgi:predicted ArsR family transcriptional regulator
MPWQSRPNPKLLKQANDRLSSALIKVREQLQVAERHRVGLEVLLDMRQERVDALTAQVEQLRRQNQKLDAEAEHLTAIIKSEGFILHANPQGRC